MARSDFTKQTKAYLLLLARRAGLTGMNRLPKAELITRLMQAPPTPSPAPGSAVPASFDDLSTQTYRSLLELAKTNGLKGVGRLRKADLIARLATAMSGPPANSASVASPNAGEPEPAVPVTTRSAEEVQPDSAENSPLSEPLSSPPPSAAALPSGYNDNRFVLLARDPHWLYAYWDFSTEEISTTLTQLGTQEARPILRVFDVTYIDFDGTNAWHHIDIELTPFATNWYISVPRPAASYCAEVGYQSPDGRFAALGRSNVVTTPRNGVSPEATLRWVTPPEKPAAFLPSPQSHPVPLTATQESAPGRPTSPSSFSAPSSAQHPSSWSLARGASPAHVRGGTLIA
ncbi:MAG TPA: DUF4912 domain-containing protein [Candidatus Binatia bacterium]|nr:DUF4912 domain-containing protein [Candidatus Binatia bacterium]